MLKLGDVMDQTRWLLFGPFRFNGVLLFCGPHLLTLGGRERNVLYELLVRAGRLVDREVLRRACGHSANMNTVDRSVCELRKVLNSMGEDVIRTISGEGYVFMAPVSMLEEVPREATRYLYKGLKLWNDRERESLWEAKACFESALRVDRAYAPAHAALADTFAILGAYWWITPREAAAKAHAAARDALTFDPDLARAHATLGFVNSLFWRNWSAAEHAFEEVLAREPSYGVGHHWYALHLAATERLPEALAEVERAAKLDPLSRSIEVHVATIRYWARDYRAAEADCQRALLYHVDFWYAHYQLGLILEAQGRLEEAAAKQRDALALPNGRTPMVQAALARACALAGQRDEAASLLNDLARQASAPFHRAVAHAALGDTGAALSCLAAAQEVQDVWFAFRAVDPRVDGLRSPLTCEKPG